MTFSGSFDRLINLTQVAKILKREKEYIIRYNPNIFPGICLKIPNKGSILIFLSGKYSIIGVKCFQQAQDMVTLATSAIMTN